MKLIYLTSRFPYPINKGDKLRSFHQIKELSKQNDIYLISLSEIKVPKSSIKQLDKRGSILRAIQKGERKKLCLKQLIINFFKYPLMTIKIITAIHFEALLLWKKGAIYRKRNRKIRNNLSFES